MPAEAVIGILITAIVTLAGVIAFLWKMALQPVFNRMLKLVETLDAELPQQTSSLKSIEASAKSAKHSSAEHLKLQKDEMIQLDAIVKNGETQRAELQKVTEAIVARGTCKAS